MLLCNYAHSNALTMLLCFMYAIISIVVLLRENNAKAQVENCRSIGKIDRVLVSNDFQLTRYLPAENKP